MSCLRFVLLVIVLSAWAEGRNKKCQMAATDPQYAATKADLSTHIPGPVEVNLDLAPEDRWTHLATPLAEQIRSLLSTFKSILGFASRALFSLFEKLTRKKVERLLTRMGPEYSGEIRGISNATGVGIVDMFIYNVIYEVMGACTSILAKDPKSQEVFHVRNMDFGLGAWDFHSHQWKLTQKLRPVLANVRFMKGGKEVFSSVSYVGYVGVHTGMRNGAFSVTADTRRDHSWWSAFRAWLNGKAPPSAKFGTHLIRDTLMSCTEYACAAKALANDLTLAPMYIIVGGVAPTEGVVISRSAKGSVNNWELAKQPASTPWVLETNYDHWNPAPWYDDRIDPGNDCMNKTLHSTGGFDFARLFQVVSAVPNRNKLTSFTVLFQAKSHRMETYIQHCKERSCVPFLADGADTIGSTAHNAVMSAIDSHEGDDDVVASAGVASTSIVV